MSEAIEFVDIEFAKENIQPLKKGRKALELKLAVRTQSVDQTESKSTFLFRRLHFPCAFSFAQTVLLDRVY